ncbi:hypothetical protein, partial [Brevundimonas sp.]|uniref:hypothetical protein n=1 Tax=Brevundimonas sp. TaxID=1871086 RepID=UPI00289B4567
MAKAPAGIIQRGLTSLKRLTRLNQTAIRFLSDVALITRVLAPLQFWLMHRSIKRPDQRFWSGLAVALTVPILLIAFALILTTIVRFPPISLKKAASGNWHEAA